MATAQKSFLKTLLRPRSVSDSGYERAPGSSSGITFPSPSSPAPGSAFSSLKSAIFRPAASHAKPEYCIVVRDYSPRNKEATIYLTLRTGQVLRVLHKYPSGFWEGELLLGGRRGFFPSAHVNAEMGLSTERAEFEASKISKISDRVKLQWSTEYPYCPLLIDPLLRAHAALQQSVLDRRVYNLQPCIADIFSCVRMVFSATQTLQSNAPVLQTFKVLSRCRKRLITALTNLLLNAKNAWKASSVGALRKEHLETVLRFSSHVVSSTRTFIAVVFVCELCFLQTSDFAASEPSTTASPQKDRAKYLISTPHREKIMQLDLLNELLFPFQPSLEMQVMETFQLVLDQCFVAISAFIRLPSYGFDRIETSTLHDLATEVSKHVENLSVLSDAFVRHPDFPRPSSLAAELTSAKDGLDGSLRILTGALAAPISGKLKRRFLVESAVKIGTAGELCFSIVKKCRISSRHADSVQDISVNCPDSDLLDPDLFLPPRIQESDSGVDGAFDISNADPSDDEDDGFTVHATSKPPSPAFDSQGTTSEMDVGTPPATEPITQDPDPEFPNPAPARVSFAKESIYSLYLYDRQRRSLSLDNVADLTKSVYATSSQRVSDSSLYSTVYSKASSRTVSTDYGVYFTRWAISQDSFGSWAPPATSA